MAVSELNSNIYLMIIYHKVNWILKTRGRFFFKGIVRRLRSNIATVIRCWRDWTVEDLQYRERESG